MLNNNYLNYVYEGNRFKVPLFCLPHGSLAAGGLESLGKSFGLPENLFSLLSIYIEKSADSCLPWGLSGISHFQNLIDLAE
jgi:hypothetical protein